MTLVSTDDHVVEHPRVWADRLPAALRADGPTIVDQARKGAPDGAAPAPVRQFGVQPNRFDEILPGFYDPKARVADMDRDGVEAQLCFPSFPKFAGTVFLQASDRELAQRCVQASNDFPPHEWCAYAQHRLIPLILLPLWDSGLAAQEIERCAARGARAIS